MTRAKNGTAERAARHAKEHGITLRAAAEMYDVSPGAVSLAFRRLYPNDPPQRGRGRAP